MNNDKEPNEPIWQSVQVRDIFYKLKKKKKSKETERKGSQREERE